MITNVTLCDFRDAFLSCGRGHNFSYDGLRVLYDWLEEMDAGSGTETVLDVIALCCDFNEYENLAEFQLDYDSENYETLDKIAERTTLIMVDDAGFIIQAF